MKAFIFSVIVSLSMLSMAQEQTEKPKIYNPDADARLELQQAIAQAKSEQKHVLVQVGGNWCPWCIKLHRFFHDNTQIDSILKADYVFLLVNYSKENKNPELMQEFEFPQRFGFPVLLVLNENGKRLHTQDSALLEEGDNYSVKKISQFLLSWNKQAIDPKSYQK